MKVHKLSREKRWNTYLHLHALPTIVCPQSLSRQRSPNQRYSSALQSAHFSACPMFLFAEAPSGLEQTHTGQINRCSIRPGPASSSRPGPLWLDELSNESKSCQCPLYGVSLNDPIFEMGKGSCPMRACSDHARGRQTFGQRHTMDISPMLLSNSCVQTASELPPQRCEIVAKQARRTAQRTRRRKE
jgi:hypothetical protein